MFWPTKQKRERNKKIKALRAFIASVYTSELQGAVTPQDRFNAYELARAQVQYEQNDLECLEQEELLSRLDNAGIDIPEEFLNGEEWPFKRTLLPKGESWAKRQLRDHLYRRVEFWCRIVLPIVSIIVSVFALLKKSH